MGTTIIDSIQGATDGLNIPDLSSDNFNFIHQLVDLITKNGTVGGVLSGILPPVLSFLIALVLAVIVWFLGMLVLKLVSKLIKNILTKNKVDVGVINFVSISVKVIFIVFLIALILGLFGVQTVSVAAVVASLGVTIGLALQGSLQNFAGGLLILVSRPFRVGDFITLPDGNRGTVEDISVIYTKIRTGDGRIIVVPNGTIANAQIMNESGNGAIRLKTHVGIDFAQDIRSARDIIVEALKKDPLVIKDKPIDVVLCEFGSSALNLEIRIWTDPANYWTLADRINEIIRYAFIDAGIEIPFNQLDVHVVDAQM